MVFFPKNSACRGLISCLFIFLFPVRQKHAENVPDKLSESEFWTRFFQSHYFHRDRITFSSKDLFADCVHADEKGEYFKLIVSGHGLLPVS